MLYNQILKICPTLASLAVRSLPDLFYPSSGQNLVPTLAPELCSQIIWHITVPVTCTMTSQLICTVVSTLLIWIPLHWE